MGKYTNIDAHNCSIEELEREIEKMKDTVNYFNNNQLATKIWLNSVYGGLANQYSEVYNVALAEAITLQGQHIIHFSSKVFDNYFKNVFHTQTELHKKLGIDLKLASKPLSFDTLQIYGDTDSVDSQTIIRTDKGNITIEDFYNKNIINGSGGITLNGHESVITNDKILNYDNNGLNYTNVKRIIRHKVSKNKWKLKTKTGKEVICTEDHSLIVFRNGKKIKVKPNEILKTDKILVIIE